MFSRLVGTAHAFPVPRHRRNAEAQLGMDLLLLTQLDLVGATISTLDAKLRQILTRIGTITRSCGRTSRR